MTDTLLTHWKALLLGWIGLQFILGMPTPKDTGATSSWWYQWLFRGLHGVAALPRLISTMFPNSFLARLFGQANGAQK